MKPIRTITVAATLAVAALGAATAGVVAQAGTNHAALRTVTLTEREFRITVSGQAAPGRVRLVVRNAGKYPHALAIHGAGIGTRKTANIKPGHSAVLSLVLRAGNYAVWCPLPGHAAEGMRATLRVAAAGAGPAPATTTKPPTTTDTSTGSTGGGYGYGY